VQNGGRYAAPGVLSDAKSGTMVQTKRKNRSAPVLGNNQEAASLKGACAHILVGCRFAPWSGSHGAPGDTSRVSGAS
jgi:hypothetical protein